MDDDWDDWGEVDDLDGGGWDDPLWDDPLWDDPGEGDGGWAVVGDDPVPGVQASHSGWGALQLGTAAAIAGHFLDQQTDRIVRAIERREAPPTAGPPAAAPAAPAPAAVPSGPPVDWDAPPLQTGDTLSRSRLATTLAVRLGARLPLWLHARRHGADPTAASRSFSIHLHGDDRPHPVLVRVDIGGGRFDVARIASVIRPPAAWQDHADVALDDPAAAVDVVEWVLARHGLGLRDYRWVAGG